MTHFTKENCFRTPNKQTRAAPREKKSNEIWSHTWKHDFFPPFFSRTLSGAGAEQASFFFLSLDGVGGERSRGQSGTERDESQNPVGKDAGLSKQRTAFSPMPWSFGRCAGRRISWIRTYLVAQTRCAIVVTRTWRYKIMNEETQVRDSQAETQPVDLEEFTPPLPLTPPSDVWGTLISLVSTLPTIST